VVRRATCAALVVGGLLTGSPTPRAEPAGGLHPGCKAGVGLVAMGLGYHLPELVGAGLGLMLDYC
jgi:hypothetical protein